MEVGAQPVTITGPQAAAAVTSQGRPRRRNQPGGLASIVTVPLDVFAEIASYLDPLDILYLARTTKYFRRLLMQPSAKHLWNAAGHNIPGIPECPSHMIEPAYTALVFIKACTYCETTISLPKHPNPELYVRLCGSCTDLSVLAYQHVPTAVQAYVPTTGDIKPRSTHNNTFSLRDDVNFVTNKLLELVSLQNPVVVDQWKANRREELNKRRIHSKMFRQYLIAAETNRGEDLEGLKQRRLAAIRVRLIENGWDEVDVHHIHPAVERPWRQLVWQAKPLTERIWSNLYPKLQPMLQTTKDRRLIQEQEENQIANHTQISIFLNNIKESERSFIKVLAGSDASTVVTLGGIILPFPGIESLKKLSFLESLKERIERRNPTIEDTKARLESWRPKLHETIFQWRANLEEELANKLSGGGLEFKPIMPSQRHLLATRHRGFVVKRVVVPAEVALTPESARHASRHTSKLLRADSIFGAPGGGARCFYPEVVDVLEQKLASENTHSGYKHGRSYDSDYGYEQEADKIQKINISSIYVDYSAQNIAGELLDRLGRPDASYLEMKAIGQRFVCARCWNKRPLEWIKIVEHFGNAYYTHQIRARFYSNSGLPFISVNLHDLGDRKDDVTVMRINSEDEAMAQEEIAQRAPAEIVTPEQANVLLSAPLPTPMFGCRLCKMVKESFVGELKEPPQGSKEEMEQHLAQEHPGTPRSELSSAVYQL